MQDAWLSAHPELSALPHHVASPIVALHQLGVTCDSPLNIFTEGKPLGGYAKRFYGKRLDYIFYRNVDTSKPSLKCISSEIRFHEKDPSCGLSLSDHFAVDATFTIGLQAWPSPFTSGNTVLPVVEETLGALIHNYRTSRQKSHTYMLIFSGCLLILFGITIGSAWLPKSWINPIFLLIAIALAWLATTLLYVGFVYGRWEINSLTNVIEELELLKVGIVPAGERSTED